MLRWCGPDLCSPVREEEREEVNEYVREMEGSEREDDSHSKCMVDYNS